MFPTFARVHAHPSHRPFLGLSLLILLGIPTFVPALHELLHYHQHLHCTADHGDVHLHADIYDCGLCDYLTTFTYLDSQASIHLDTHFAETSIAINTEATFVFPHAGAYHLRGPPMMSHAPFSI
jgi:hypothetical protein